MSALSNPKVFLALLGSLMLSFGCTMKRPLETEQVTLIEHIYRHTSLDRMRNARVGVFGFESPINAPMVGFDAANILYHKLLERGVFQQVFPESDALNLTIQQQLELAKSRDYDLIITGKVLYYFDGSALEASRVDQQIRIIEVSTGGIFWYAETVEIGETILDSDYLVVEFKGQPAPSALDLMGRNAGKLCSMLL